MTGMLPIGCSCLFEHIVLSCLVLSCLVLSYFSSVIFCSVLFSSLLLSSLVFSYRIVCLFSKLIFSSLLSSSLLCCYRLLYSPSIIASFPFSCCLSYRWPALRKALRKALIKASFPNILTFVLLKKGAKLSPFFVFFSTLRFSFLLLPFLLFYSFLLFSVPLLFSFCYRDSMSIVQFLDDLKQGWGAKYGPTLQASGLEDLGDAQDLSQMELNDLLGRALRAAGTPP